MTTLDDARSHLAKANEFLAAAEFSLDLELFNAATSNAVLAGINAKDAICLRLTGTTQKTDNHSSAVAELKGAGPAGAALAPTLGRLLKLKSKAQYQARAIAAADAANAVRWATKMVEGTAEVVAAR